MPSANSSADAAAANSQIAAATIAGRTVFKNILHIPGYGRTAFRGTMGIEEAGMATRTPARHESNWIQTVPGKGWFFLFLRRYGPREP